MPIKRVQVCRSLTISITSVGRREEISTQGRPTGHYSCDEVRDDPSRDYGQVEEGTSLEKGIRSSSKGEEYRRL